MIILDMEIPKSCFDCRFRTDTGMCELTGFYTSYQPLTMPLSELCPIKAEIPKDATNGDVIKAMFPQFDVNEEWKATRHFEFKSKECIEITGIATSDWWDAKWKGQENECCK